jgi:hypothetical protein
MACQKGQEGCFACRQEGQGLSLSWASRATNGGCPTSRSFLREVGHHRSEPPAVRPQLSKQSKLRGSPSELVDTVAHGLVQWPPGKFLGLISKGHGGLLHPTCLKREVDHPVGGGGGPFHSLHRGAKHANSPSGSKSRPPVSKLVQVRISEVRRCLKIL